MHLQLEATTGCLERCPFDPKEHDFWVAQRSPDNASDLLKTTMESFFFLTRKIIFSKREVELELLAGLSFLCPGWEDWSSEAFNLAVTQAVTFLTLDY